MPMFILTAPFLGLCCEHAPPVERACCYGRKCSEFLGFGLFSSLPLPGSSCSSCKDIFGGVLMECPPFPSLGEEAINDPPQFHGLRAGLERAWGNLGWGKSLGWKKMRFTVPSEPSQSRNPWS